MNTDGYTWIRNLSKDGNADQRQVEKYHPQDREFIEDWEWEQVEPLFTSKTRVEQLEQWLTDLEDNGLPAQCSTRVLLKVKDELGLLEDEDSDSLSQAEGENE